ncbi:hypothetical protein M911_08590 [Ectothiorhodospira haloalkaliphila]|uniref:Uncharacterized protein n=1 Tax=Ectothiorhodospira haloalkaliphila TaxID=421628 RepID=W8KQD6_9GAMM|nr:hypothetical protein M911_08590 [Ectothiorhodospira haloalkaliphila]
MTSPAWRNAPSPRCPEASDSDWPSPPRSPRTPRCFCWTNPPITWTCITRWRYWISSAGW